ncbi:MAG: Type 1 glutamine amidotransferase-like domain-containing protein [Alphaproteobacteria bacterium]|nr:Type 1 glutamine amidotransferase-like domain-containing protein [Alphaproteobacteria bacterium]
MKIIAIGGGDIGSRRLKDGVMFQYPVETTAIDKKIIEMSGKKNPRLLFVDTAGGYQWPSYQIAVDEHFGQELGCIISRLPLANEAPTEKEMRKVLDNTDIIYVGGGDTLFMLERWRATGFDKLLKEYGERGIILSGLSAGAVCWFDWADNEDHIDGDFSKLEIFSALGFIKGWCFPHWDDKSDTEKQAIITLAKSHGILCYGVDNCAAIVFEDGKMSFVSSKQGAEVHILNSGEK